MTTSPHPIRIRRIHLPAAPEDGARVLVDRLWPRGISKARAGLSLWLKEIAPTNALRTWFAHEPVRWPEFERRYRAELADRQAELQLLHDLAAQGPLTLLYAAHDEAHNNAVVLAAVLREGQTAADRAGVHRKPG